MERESEENREFILTRFSGSVIIVSVVIVVSTATTAQNKFFKHEQSSLGMASLSLEEGGAV
ncbi:hypothetical protein D7L35_11365 [Enterococcus faecalis]|nr:hypothetical protein [Enterococcus faecalis]